MPNGQPARGIDHVGLCVHDIEDATTFLSAALGAEVVSETLSGDAEAQSGALTEQRFGLAAGSTITAIRMLRLRTGAGIELFQIRAPDQRPAARSSDLGWQHVAVITDDLQASLDLFERAGGEILAAPATPRPGSGYRYARATFGALVEFVEA